MSEILHELHEDELQSEVLHHQNEIATEKELIREHTSETAGNKLEKAVCEAELHHEQKVLEREEKDLAKDQEKLDAVEGKKVVNQEACDKAEEFKKLADEAEEHRIIDEDLFETPSQPLK